MPDIDGSLVGSGKSKAVLKEGSWASGKQSAIQIHAQLVIYGNCNEFFHKPLATSLNRIFLLQRLCAISVHGSEVIDAGLWRGFWLVDVACLREETLGAGKAVSFFR